MTSSVPRPSVFEAERVWKKLVWKRTLLSVAFDFSISILSGTSILPTPHPQPTRVKALSVPSKASNEDRGLSPIGVNLRVSVLTEANVQKPIWG
jgi:hypothetical protein